MLIRLAELLKTSGYSECGSQVFIQNIVCKYEGSTEQIVLLQVRDKSGFNGEDQAPSEVDEGLQVKCTLHGLPR